MRVAVIGGGIAGLSAAYAIEREAKDRGIQTEVRLFERAPAIGGKIQTALAQGGALIEEGPNGWLDSRPAIETLVRELGLYGDRVGASEGSAKRFVWREGRLHRVPEGPGAFLRSGLLSWRGKARLLGEPWAKGRPDGDESVADFARRRLGHEALSFLIDPMVTGIYAGDPERMSLRSCFPRIARLEEKHGGLFRGLFAVMRERRAGQRVSGSEPQRGPRAGPAGPGGRLMSLRGGLSRLISTLGAALSNAPQVAAPVERLQRHGSIYRLSIAGQPDWDAERVVVATPAWAARDLVAPLSSAAAAELAGIPYAPVAVVALGWQRAKMPHPLDGYGFLVPGPEQREILGCLWDTSLFAGRAPEDFVLTRTLVGGMRRPELAGYSQEELVALVRRELEQALGVRAEPSVVRVVAHPRAIPQYAPGHAARLARLSQALVQAPGLVLAGNAYQGIGMEDCVAAAPAVAEAILGDGRPCIARSRQPRA